MGCVTPLSKPMNFRPSFLTLAFVILHSAFGIQAAEPAAKPFLRIEAGMHTAPIRRIATDAAGGGGADVQR